MPRLEIIAKFFLALVLSMLLFTGGLALPPLGAVLLPFVAQPVLVFGMKYGIAAGIGIVGLALLLFLIFAGEELALIYGIFALIAGLLLGLLGRLRAIETLIVSIATVVSAATAGLLLYFFGSWSAMAQDFRQNIAGQIAAAVRMHEKLGFPVEGMEAIKERSPQMIETLLQLLPALVFLSVALMVLINIAFLCRRFPERREQWLSIQNLREWKGPEPVVWGLILCGFGLFVPGLEFLRAAIFNVLLLVAAIYFAQGLSVIGYFFHKNNVPRFLRGLTYLLIVFQQLITLLVVGLGLFDLWGDFRRLGKDNLTPSQVA